MAEHDYPREYRTNANFHKLRIPEIVAKRKLEAEWYEPVECNSPEEIDLLPATDIDIEQRRIQQIQRYLELDQSSSLTSEWAEFGIRNAPDIIYHYLTQYDRP